MEHGMRPRLLLGDDHQLVAEAMKHLLTQEFDVIGIVNDGRTLVQAARRLRPDVVIADIAMPKLNGLDAGHRIKNALPDVKLIYVSMNTDSVLVAEARAIGASAFLSKTSSRLQLIGEIKRALASKNGNLQLVDRVCSQSTSTGEAGSTPTESAGLSSRTLLKVIRRGGPQLALTERQKDVLQLLAEGHSMKQVASVLNIATRTVAFHKYRIMSAVNASNDAELVHFAVGNHLVFVQDAAPGVAVDPMASRRVSSPAATLSRRLRQAA
jgi:DNA-binding NarL/FixJ family response regulator